MGNPTLDSDELIPNIDSILSYKTSTCHDKVVDSGAKKVQEFRVAHHSTTDSLEQNEKHCTPDVPNTLIDPGSIRSAVLLPGALPDSGKHHFLRKSVTCSSEQAIDSEISALKKESLQQDSSTSSNTRILKEHCLCCTPWCPVSGVLSATSRELTFEPDPRSQLVRDQGIGALQVYVDIDDILACALLMLPDGPLLTNYFGLGSHSMKFTETSQDLSEPFISSSLPREEDWRCDVATFFQIVVRTTHVVHSRTSNVSFSDKSLLVERHTLYDDASTCGEVSLKEASLRCREKSLYRFSRDYSFQKVSYSHSEICRPTITRAQSMPSLPSMMTFKKKWRALETEKPEHRKLLDRFRLSRSLLGAVTYSHRFFSNFSPFHRKKNYGGNLKWLDMIREMKGHDTVGSMFFAQDHPAENVYSSLEFRRYKSEPCKLAESTIFTGIHETPYSNSLVAYKTKKEESKSHAAEEKNRRSFQSDGEEEYVTVLFRIHNQMIARQFTSFTMDAIDARKHECYGGKHIKKGTLLDDQGSLTTYGTRSLTSLGFHSNDVLEAFLLSPDAQERLFQYALQRFHSKTYYGKMKSVIALAFHELQTWKTLDQTTEDLLEEGASLQTQIYEAFEPSTHLSLPRIENLSSNAVVLITEDIAYCLARYVPPRLLLCVWKLGYCTKSHGLSFSTFFHRLAGLGPCLFLIRDTQGTLFGAFCSVSVRECLHYYGTGECFVFTFKSSDTKDDSESEKHGSCTALNGSKKYQETISVYLWTRKNAYFVFSDSKTIAFGGGGGYAITVDSNFLRGSSSPCVTYNNPCLSSSPDFLIRHLQVWYFGDL